MKIKKIYIVILAVLMIILIGGYEIYTKIKQDITNRQEIEFSTNNNFKLFNGQTEILHTLVGLESKEMKIIDNPLRIEGEFKVPEETALNGINYYLKTTKNKEINDVDIRIEKDKIIIGAKYKLLNTFKTPMEVSIIPSITKSSDIKLHISDVTVLGFSIDEELVDAIVDSWFSNIKGIKVEKGDVIVDKNNSKDIAIKSISLDTDNLIISLSMKLD